MRLPKPTVMLEAFALAVVSEFVSRTASAGAGKLLVFLHVALKQRAFEGELQAALPGVEVRAVGRLADFERALGDGADAVLSLPPLLTAHGLTPKLQGLHGGS